MLTDLAFLITTLGLLYSFILYGKNVILKDFGTGLLVGFGFIIEVDDGLDRQFF